MTLRYGTDTSVLMRLLTGHPEDEYERCRRELTQMVQQNQSVRSKFRLPWSAERDWCRSNGRGSEHPGLPSTARGH